MLKYPWAVSAWRLRRSWAGRNCTSLAALAATLLIVISLVAPAPAHEGHDHDKPAPLNLPVAPRVVAVTPDYELVGIVSGDERLTIFLHRFETGEPVKGATLSLSSGEQQADAKRVEDGVFEAVAAWLKAEGPLDLVFHLTIDGEQDILAGTLERKAQPAVAGPLGQAGLQRDAILVAVALMAGVLLALFVAGMLRNRRNREAVDQAPSADVTPARGKVAALRRGAMAWLVAGSLTLLLGEPSAQAQGSVKLPSVPATMATDVPQRMPDGSLFVPKGTQHLLGIRTALTAETKAPRTVQLVGTITPDPNSFGRVQTGHAGRIDVPKGGLPFVGKRVEAGEVLAFLQHHIEAYNKGNLQAEIAELDARIALQETKLGRYMQAPLAIPPIRIDETKGELQALKQKRKELAPTLSEREEIRAPIGGIVSTANVVAGQSVDAREVLFEIVDPARFWVEAITHDASVATNLKAAFAVTHAGEQLELEFAGLGLALKQQAAPLSFRLKQLSNGLSIGQPVTVILQSTVEVSGIVLPSSSLVRMPSGLASVWVKAEAERFEPYTVRFEPLDGQRIVVLSGLKLDARVVTIGASLLNQIR